jgi:hypothetical protein
MGLAITFKKLLLGRAFSTERGRIKLFGYMDWTLVPSYVLAEILQNIGEMKGKDYLYELGFKQGNKVAKDFIKYMGIKLRGGWVSQRAILDLLEFIGFGKAEFVRSKIQKDGQHHFIFHVKHNPVVEYAKSMYGSKSMVCNWFMGVYAAHGEMEMGIKNSHIVENKCICKGDHYCEWETKWVK